MLPRRLLATSAVMVATVSTLVCLPRGLVGQTGTSCLHQASKSNFGLDYTSTPKQLEADAILILSCDGQDQEKKCKFCTASHITKLVDTDDWQDDPDDREDFSPREITRGHTGFHVPDLKKDNPASGTYKPATFVIFGDCPEDGDAFWQAVNDEDPVPADQIFTSITTVP